NPISSLITDGTQPEVAATTQNSAATSTKAWPEWNATERKTRSPVGHRFAASRPRRHLQDTSHGQRDRGKGVLRRPSGYRPLAIATVLARSTSAWARSGAAPPPAWPRTWGCRWSSGRGSPRWPG